ncbi:MAG: hypothetical protein JWP19_1073 [Rhodoglobus sp.]|nr:hypothetical protein [Rhodoglobus sp.]
MTDKDTPEPLGAPEGPTPPSAPEAPETPQQHGWHDGDEEPTEGS